MSVTKGDAHDLAELAEPAAALIVSLAPAFDAIVAPATSRFKNVMPRVAARLDVMLISEIIKVVAPVRSNGRSMPATRSKVRPRGIAGGRGVKG
jgi:electron transfer flavoprotein alpha subunit